MIPTNEFDDDGKVIIPKTIDELKAEYKKCNEAMTAGPDKCVELPECCFFTSYDPLYDEGTNKCVSLENYVRFTVRNSEKYLKQVGIHGFHSRITENNFCEILSYDKNIVRLRRCRCKLSQVERGAAVPKIMATLALLLLGVFFSVGN